MLLFHPHPVTLSKRYTRNQVILIVSTKELLPKSVEVQYALSDTQLNLVKRIYEILTADEVMKKLFGQSRRLVTIRLDICLYELLSNPWKPFGKKGLVTEKKAINNRLQENILYSFSRNMNYTTLSQYCTSISCLTLINVFIFHRFILYIMHWTILPIASPP